MDKLIEYPKLIKRILTEYIELCDRSSQQDIETFLIADEQNGHYIWMNLGWPHGDRKFWIEEVWTEDGIATDLVRAGVPKEDIVLAFHEPGMRQYTDFAVAS
ncbi:XisI protein [Microcoleus sp. Pol11C2]|uniref:XisI protein n=1 Tax=Microcoleus sp. Pol11C2 TaxID=3055389 RepID=UPI002FD6A091